MNHLETSIFQINNENDFLDKALKIFRFQSQHNPVYRQFLNYLKVQPEQVGQLEDIPFLPIEFFKSHQVASVIPPFQAVFKSSGTTGMQRSHHYVKSLKLYEQSFFKGFKYFYGDITQYAVLALLPSYVEQGHSSLVYMVDQLIKRSTHPASGFYLNDRKLPHILNELQQQKQKTILIGVSYALLDLVEKYQFNLEQTIVMETGGMKGRRKELLREELHQYLKAGFGVENIHSEYGMTELLSQAYSNADGIFKSPPWQKIMIRDTEDPLSYLAFNKTGGINVIDLANIYSCSFIATQDLGRQHPDGSFEILGRFDHSDIRGCNLMVV